MKERIVFMGTPAFAVASLDALVNAGLKVAAVVTAPDRPAGRGLQLRTSAVKDRAVELGIPVLQPEKLRDPAFLEALDRIDADLYVVVAFRMLPEAVWSRPRLGTINLHASLLPDYRGAAPINWAVMNGETRTGLTTFFIQQQIDTGDLIAREEIAIAPDETAGELHDRMMVRGGALLTRTVQEIFAGTAPRRPQHAFTDAPLHEAPKLTPAITRIDWTSSVRAVHDRVRGLSPFPGAWTQLLIDDKAPMHFKVFRSRPVNEPMPAAPGTAVVKDDRMIVRCADGALELLEVQPEGKRRMPVSELVRGMRFERSLRMQ
jgi:methionyl-tRNA formyltransferase